MRTLDVGLWRPLGQRPHPRPLPPQLWLPLHQLQCPGPPLLPQHSCRLHFHLVVARSARAAVPVACPVPGPRVKVRPYHQMGPPRSQPPRRKFHVVPALPAPLLLLPHPLLHHLP